MIKKEYLSLVAMEECAELQQALFKSLRFGFDDHHPNREEQSNEYQVSSVRGALSISCNDGRITKAKNC